jgi:hypothetical protein
LPSERGESNNGCIEEKAPARRRQADDARRGGRIAVNIAKLPEWCVEGDARAGMSAFDPTATSAAQDCCFAT